MIAVGTWALMATLLDEPEAKSPTKIPAEKRQRSS
jgi:hypothetical protein